MVTAGDTREANRRQRADVADDTAGQRQARNRAGARADDVLIGIGERSPVIVRARLVSDSAADGATCGAAGPHAGYGCACCPCLLE